MDRATQSLFAGAVAGGALVATWLGAATPVLALVLVFVTLMALRRGSVTVWLSFLLVWVVAGRGIVSVFGASHLLSFGYFPLVAAFALSAILRTEPGLLRRSGALKWMIGLLAMTAVSFLATPVHPVRTGIFLAIATTPLLVVLGIELAKVDQRDVRVLAMVALGLMLLQLPIGAVQGATLGWMDPVRGTLTTHEAGAHLVGGLMSLVVLILWYEAVAGRIALRVAVPLGAAGLWMMVAAGAIQVIIALGLGLVVATVLGLLRGRRRYRAHKWIFATLIGGVVVASSAIFLVLPGGVERISRVFGPANLPVTQVATERLAGDRVGFLFGSGPGAGASRASVLFTESMQKTDSPTTLFNLEATPLAREIVDRSLDPEHGGSAEKFVSSAMSALVDLGLVGALVLAAGITLLVWRLRSPSPLALAAAGALVMTGVLSFVDMWLEMPEFTIPLAVLVGLGLKLRSEPAEGR